MDSVKDILLMVTGAVRFLLLVYIIISFLFALDILNRRQQFVVMIYSGLDQVFTPLLDPIRRLLPSTGGLDFSPLLLFLALYAIDIVVVNNL